MQTDFPAPGTAGDKQACGIVAKSAMTGWPSASVP